jgi:hypothetical protein
MAMGKRRQLAKDHKAARKETAMMHPSGESKYGRKKKYCDNHGLFGFQIPDPKPWI